MLKTAAIAVLLALLALPALAQNGTGTEGGGTGDQPVDPPAITEPAEPVDPNAPIVVGKDDPLPGPAEATQPKCDCCGLFWDQSPTRIEAVVKRAGVKESVRYESLGCMLRDIAKSELKLLKFQVLDYATAGMESEVMLDGDSAFFVYDARPIPGSSAPYIAAFENEARARTAMGWLEGDSVVDYDALYKRYVADLTANVAMGDDLPLNAVIPPGEDWFVCPCAGGCCDHIKSDVEGSCSECGMILVRRSEKLRLERERRGILSEEQVARK